MERDPLETFVQVNRTAFDQALPDHDLWNKIEQELPSDTKVVPIRRRGFVVFMKYAAAVLAIVSASVFGTMQYMKANTATGISNELLAEINEITDFYDFEVNRKLSALAAYGTDPEVNQELQAIDEVIAELKVELDEVPTGSEEKVINAMISNFQLKILILERLLEAQENNLSTSEIQNNEINI